MGPIRTSIFSASPDRRPSPVDPEQWDGLPLTNRHRSAAQHPASQIEAVESQFAPRSTSLGLLSGRVKQMRYKRLISIPTAMPNDCPRLISVLQILRANSMRSGVQELSISLPEPFEPICQFGPTGATVCQLADEQCEGLDVSGDP